MILVQKAAFCLLAACAMVCALAVTAYLGYRRCLPASKTMKGLVMVGLILFFLLLFTFTTGFSRGIWTVSLEFIHELPTAGK